ncbi:MAG: tetratricopeptide repeat protein [Deltaproteobacteria bacterium]|nr:tetratricopeptide repeat protein [Deltaproteobacteria bacterium]
MNCDDHNRASHYEFPHPHSLPVGRGNLEAASLLLPGLDVKIERPRATDRVHRLPFRVLFLLHLLMRLLLFSWLFFTSVYAADSVAVGVTLFEERNIIGAHQFFATFVQEHPTNAVGAFYLGRTYFAQEQFEQAIEWLDKAVLLDGNNADYHLWLGRACGYQAQRASILWQFPLARRVREHFERAVELNPAHLGARADLAEYYMKAPWFLGGGKEKAEEQAHEVSRRNLEEGLRIWRMIAAEEGSNYYTSGKKITLPPASERN